MVQIIISIESSTKIVKFTTWVQFLSSLREQASMSFLLNIIKLGGLGPMVNYLFKCVRMFFKISCSQVLSFGKCDAWYLGDR